MNFHLLLASVPLLILLNAFFVAGEYAVVAIRPVHLAEMRASGRRAAADAMERLKANPTSAIATIQVCITVTNLLLGWLGEPAMATLLTLALGPLAAAIPQVVFTPVSIALSFLVVTLLTVVFSELLPKAMTLRHTKAAATVTAAPVLAIGWAIRPLVWLMNAMANLVTRPLGLGRVEQIEAQGASVEELRLLAADAGRYGVLSPQEQTLVLNALSLGQRTARQIMVPRVQIAYLDLQRSMDENRRVMNQHLYSRLPLCNGSLDEVVGVVQTKQFLSAYHARGDVSVLALIADEAVFAPQIATTSQLLTLFHEKKTTLLLLVDEYGGLAGIVTLMDVIDDLMGDVDEARALSAEAPQGDSESAGRSRRPRQVRGDLPVHELARLLNRPDWAQSEEAATVGGLVQDRLGHIGSPREEVEVEGVVLRVVRSDRRAIRRLEVEIASTGDEKRAAR